MVPNQTETAPDGNVYSRPRLSNRFAVLACESAEDLACEGAMEDEDNQKETACKFTDVNSQIAELRRQLVVSKKTISQVY
jgi:hypothetical protein